MSSKPLYEQPILNSLYRRPTRRGCASGMVRHPRWLSTWMWAWPDQGYNPANGRRRPKARIEIVNFRRCETGGTNKVSRGIRAGWRNEPVNTIETEGEMLGLPR